MAGHLFGDLRPVEKYLKKDQRGCEMTDCVYLPKIERIFRVL